MEAAMVRKLLVALPFLSFAILVPAGPPAEAFPGGYAYTPPYEAWIVVAGSPLREIYHQSRNYVVGANGERYSVRVRNNTGRRVEIVASVDGLDVVDGKPADFVRKRGYVIGPYQTYDIEGFRLDMGRVAAFRFAPVGESYAAKTGNARNVGIIGVAFFAERVPPPPPAPRPIEVPRYEDRRTGGASPAPETTATPVPAASAPPPAKAAEGGWSGPSGDGARDAAARSESEHRPGLGTEFGESRNSRVRETSFQRASDATPSQILTVYYNDRPGLISMGVPVDPPPPSDSWQRNTANPFPANPRSRQFSAPPEGWSP
jgi:hypothetical protein